MNLETSSFSWSSHIKTAVSKANRLLGLIRRTLGTDAPIQAKLLLYTSLVRSALSYASIIWHPNKEDIKLFEGVQRQATKYILNDYTSDYKTRLSKCKLLPFCFYREINDLCFFYKCQHKFTNFNVDDIVSFYAPEFPRTRRSRQGLLLNTPVFNTVAAEHFYSSRIVKLWNDLPLAARSCYSDNKFIRSFKSSSIGIILPN